MALTPVAPPPFRYVRPESIEAALEAMSSESALALAGGADLVTLRANGAVAPETLVDIKAIAELSGVGGETDHVIGAATPLRALVDCGRPGLDAILDGARIVGAAPHTAVAGLELQAGQPIRRRAGARTPVDGGGRGDRLLRSHRARRGLGSRGDADTRTEGRLGLGDDGQKMWITRASPPRTFTGSCRCGRR
jgi:hypothetical protein